MKAGCFNLVCGRLDLYKLGRNTHLYIAGSPDSSLCAYGKLFLIKEIHPFEGRSIKTLGKEFRDCSVTARNLPISSDALAKRMGVTSKGDTHIFAFTADFAGAASGRFMAVTGKA